MTNTELNYSSAEPQRNYPVIPDKTLAKVRMTLKGGGYDDESKGWKGGWATKSDKTDAVYLKCEFTIIGGKYDNRKIWSLIGLHSDKGPNYARMGRSFIRTLLESANGIDSDDVTEAADKARTIKSFQELDGIEFIAQIDVQLDQDGNDKNTIRYAITKENKDYNELMYPASENGRYKLEDTNKTFEPQSPIQDDEIPF